MSNPLKPALSLLMKLGSAVIHAEELLGVGGHPLDRQAFDRLVADHEVVEWVGQMNELALLPVKR